MTPEASGAGASGPAADDAPADASLTLVETPGTIEVRVRNLVLARYVFVPDVPRSESPRPYFHPVRALDGTLVTDFRPEDHTWHHGLSLALPFVGPVNLWGGRSWDAGSREYIDKADNGSMRHDSVVVGGSLFEPGFTEELTWLDALGTPLAAERRHLTFDRSADEWRIHWRSEVVNRSGGPLSFGSPSTHGRAGAGYGGIFFRAAPIFADGRLTADPRISPPSESAVQGAIAKSVSVTAADGAGPRVTMSVPDSPSPWFVRTHEYPGFGPAPFFTREALVPEGGTLEFACTIAVASAASTASAASAGSAGSAA